jgi:DNA mismatch endonuclease (patch repair protein)
MFGRCPLLKPLSNRIPLNFVRITTRVQLDCNPDLSQSVTIPRFAKKTQVSAAPCCSNPGALTLDLLEMRTVMDTLSRKERSQRMSLIRNRDTKPELLVRRMIHRSGYRYRLHCTNLPGKPDLVFPGRKKVIFVHGCFWHRHPSCGLARLPKSRLSFWLPKLTENRRRDLKNLRNLRKLGWTVKVVWECEIGDRSVLAGKLQSFLSESQ